jgi:GMP synthase (glutamine-hydrolysing)
MGAYEIGYRTVEHCGGRLFEGVPEEFLVFTTHSDAVTELPPGAEVTAENDYGVHGFRKDHVFGVQSHPEYDRETAEHLVDGKDLAPGVAERVREGITDENVRRAAETKRVFDNFLDYVRMRRAGAGAEAAAGDD